MIVSTYIPQMVFMNDRSSTVCQIFIWDYTTFSVDIAPHAEAAHEKRTKTPTTSSR
jgi:hypothetical protein